MEKTISTTQLKNDPDAVLREVGGGDEAVLVESPVAPTAAIISLDEYRRLREIDDRQRRRQAFDELEGMRNEISRRFSDLSNEERIQFAEELSKDTLDRIIATGQFRFVEG